ncbi:MAG: sodium-dependent transporter [Planctomycetaceae bacterium]|jgi:SNF family Na+-dependent transporter|nr:sodium-dependent transporter [Planctomycetaceae bacterium]
MHLKDNWTSQLGIILAVVGSAVGLGNFLRFPGQMALYGGIAFMIPYIVALLLLGLPLAWTEWTMGRYGGVRGHNSAPGIFRSIIKRRRVTYAGSLFVMMPVIIFSYYIIIEGWCLIYAIQYARGIMNLGTSQAYSESFAQLVGMSENGKSLKAAFSNPSVICIVICFVLNFWLVYRGISKGIERFCVWALPVLLICSTIIFIRVATLGNPTGIEGQSFLDGLKFVWTTTGSDQTIVQHLADPECWLAAAGQVFFSLSVGFGLILTYASYLKAKDDVAASCVTAVGSNSIVEIVYGGMMIVPAAVMFLGHDAINKENLGSSFTLGFQTLPCVFEQMPMGQLFGFLFFFLLFLAAITSSISMLQPAIALFEDGLGLKRKGSVLLLGGLMLGGSLFVLYFSKGLVAMDTFDFWIANIFILFSASFMVFLFGWGLGIDTAMTELERGAQIPIPRFVRYLIQYVTPLFLVTILVAWCWLKLPERFAEICNDNTVQLSIGVLLLFELFFLWVVSRAIKRWDEVEKLREGERNEQESAN